MKKKVFSRFTMILFVIGLMTAIQFNTINEPDSRDTRDVWEIRQELSREKQLHSELLSEIGTIDETLEKYKESESDSPEQALQETVETLRKEAGLTELTGPGLRIVIEPSPEAVATGQNIEQISPALLIRFVNEINRFNAIDLAIDGKRLINTSPIRDINGRTTVNGEPIGTPPLEMTIVAGTFENAEKLYNHLNASPILDNFYIDNLSVDVKRPQKKITIEAYNEELELDHLKAAEGE
ncbi:DUF881 domain-containing protein [Planococcus salinarum]|uniref:DUF881 domain-containing protein n=1 Tax=Planococcus salinarum TaxID=622695 RepID=UPI000E3B7C79|nr:DUF881 domain-containing protein [Planococcus salinarum]TAA68704.1 DUF881 domain-containing protein [Planococcus salinarum]